jgi:hypothetical protein
VNIEERTMIAATDIAITSSARGQPWRVLLWLAPLAAFWIVLNYWVPGLQASGVPSTTTRLAIHIAIGLGLWLALERTELAPSRRIAVWLALVVPYTLWLAVIWSAAINGVFRPGNNTPPLVPFAIFLPLIVGVPILLRSKRIGEVLDATPASWLIGLQVYRIFGGIFLVGWARGVVPGLFALPAGIGDVTTGLLALPIAYYLASRNGYAVRSGIAWNILGLVDFTIAVGLGLATAPGPLQLIVPSIPNTGVGLYPTVLIPAFAVPSSILLHVLSLRQLRRGMRFRERTWPQR